MGAASLIAAAAVCHSALMHSHSRPHNAISPTLHLIAKHVGPAAAHSMARLLMLQWHAEGQAPYTVFRASTEHGDAVIRHLQDWLQAHYMVERPLEEMRRRSGLPRRSFERRFAKATGFAPNGYVQQLRVEEAKKRLERTGKPIDEISFDVGYEDPAHFRRLFKRITQMTPGGYRRRFQMPAAQAQERGGDLREQEGGLPR